MNKSHSTYRIVQPWGKDKAQQATLISEHVTVAEAFRETDRLAIQMLRTGAPSDAVELSLIDYQGRIVTRPGAQ